MGSLINPSALTFDGGMSTAPQYSNSLAGVFQQRDVSAFMFGVNFIAGNLGITLQMNADPLGQAVFSWVDFATTADQVLEMLTGTFLGQTNALIAAGIKRSGIIEAAGSGNGYYLLRFSPLQGVSYRIKFECESATRATVTQVMTIP